MIDESGSMKAETLSPATQKIVAEFLAKYPVKEELKEFPDKKYPRLENIYKKGYDEDYDFNKISKNYEEFPPRKILTNSFNEKFNGKLVIDIQKDFAEIFAECKLTPTERTQRAQERAEALAEACHSGTTSVTTVMRPLSLRRGFITFG